MHTSTYVGRLGKKRPQPRVPSPATASQDMEQPMSTHHCIGPSEMPFRRPWCLLFTVSLAGQRLSRLRRPALSVQQRRLGLLSPSAAKREHCCTWELYGRVELGCVPFNITGLPSMSQGPLQCRGALLGIHQIKRPGRTGKQSGTPCLREQLVRENACLVGARLRGRSSRTSVGVASLQQGWEVPLEPRCTWWESRNSRQATAW